MSARSSDSIRHIAKALAAAQRELQNPQPRHEGQIRRELPSGLALIEPYRFASLGDGLALIRPVLGRHGLSLIQATRLDSQAALLILETRIIHESGEWILADYPVGSIPPNGASDPRELGAALTYARRQSLFSLIGIAPQNDTDGSVGGAELQEASVASPPPRRTAGQIVQPDAPPSDQKLPLGSDRANFEGRPHGAGDLAHAGSLVSGRSSEETFHMLSGEVERLSCPDGLRNWAMERIKVMASLLPQDRRRLNEAFVAKRNSFELPSPEAPHRVHQPTDGNVELRAGMVAPANGVDTRDPVTRLRRRPKISGRSQGSSGQEPVTAAAPAAGGGRRP